MLEQKALVEQFIRHEFQDPVRGTNLRAHHTYDQPITFSKALRVHLEELLDALVRSDRQRPVWGHRGTWRSLSGS